MAFQPRVIFGDSGQLDPLGRLRVSPTSSIFEYSQEYGIDTLRFWDIAVNGTLAASSTNAGLSNAGASVGPTDTNSRTCPIVLAGTNGEYAVLQTRAYLKGVPGRGSIYYITGVFAAGSGYSAKFVFRGSASGSPVDISISQASWNYDKFDGTGPTGATLDFTKSQTIVIDVAFTGAARVRMGFIVNGAPQWAHIASTSNIAVTPSVQTGNLPVRMEGRTTAGVSTFNAGLFDGANGVFFSTSRSTPGGTAYFFALAVESDGIREVYGNPVTAPTSIVTTAVTTRRPVLSIRPKDVYNGIVNRAHIADITYGILAKTNDAYLELVIGGTLTGASFTSAGTHSIAEFDTAATAITGGVVVAISSAATGLGATSTSTRGQIDPRRPLSISKIDSLATTQPIVSIVCTSFSGTSNITPMMQWYELSS